MAKSKVQFLSSIRSALRGSAERDWYSISVQRPSACLGHSSIVSKRLNESSKFFTSRDLDRYSFLKSERRYDVPTVCNGALYMQLRYKILRSSEVFCQTTLTFLLFSPTHQSSGATDRQTTNVATNDCLYQQSDADCLACSSSVVISSQQNKRTHFDRTFFHPQHRLQERMYPFAIAGFLV